MIFEKIRRISRLVLTGGMLGGLMYLLVFGFKGILRARFAAFFFGMIFENIDLVIKFMIFILIASLSILVLIVFLIATEREKMRKKFPAYKSKHVVEDYYQGYQGPPPDWYEKQGERNEPVREGEWEEPDTDEGVADGVFRKYYGDGAVKKEAYYHNGKLEGTVKIFYRNGILKREASYQGSVLNGPWRNFYPNGRLRNEKSYKGGKLNGLHKAYDEEGVPLFEISYRDDIQDGTDKIYYRNGMVQYEDTYENGARVRRRTYDEEGKLKFEHLY